MTRMLSLVAALSLAVTSATFAQTPDGKPADTQPADAQPAHQQRPPMPPPTNLQVLPKDMTSEQVVGIMRQWTGELGVKCGYCHARDAATNRLNFASDANTMKDRARVMMKMTHTINAEYLSQLTNPAPEHDVNCGTCHRGMAKPAVFTPPAEERH